MTKNPKEEHEKCVGHALMKLLRYHYKFIGHGEDGVQPDLIYSIEGRKIGVEITTEYYDDDDDQNHHGKVKFELARGNLKPARNEYLRLGSWTADSITARVQQRLIAKSSKDYSEVDAVLVCIHHDALILDSSEVLDLARVLKVSPKFERIYLSWFAHAGEGGGFRACVLRDTTSSNEIGTILSLPKRH
jgi:hypothetical protein